MRPRLFAALLVLCAAPTSALAQDGGPPAPAPHPFPDRPPPIGDTPPPEQAILLIPTAVTTCGGAPVQPVYAHDLPPGAVRHPVSAPPTSTVLAFSIAADGRTRDIRPADDLAGGRAGAGDDAVQAVFAGWRFPAAAKADCRLTVGYTPRPMAEAETGDLLRYFAVTRTTGDIRRVVGDRLAGPQADCAARQRGQRRVRTRSYPDFDIGVRPPPGGRSWTVVRWNVDDQGRATNVETLGSSGDAALDAETRRAVSETVLAGGSPARGCVYNFHRNGLTLVAPDMPAAADRPEDPLQNCPADVGASYKTRMEPIYPRAFRERGIEGWALVRFDIATWGQVGNVEVIEAQPAAAFGESARHAVMTGSARPGFEAGVRCVIPIRYRTSDAAEALEPSTD